MAIFDSWKSLVRGRTAWETALLLAAAAAALFSFISISLAQGFWAIACLLWIVLLLEKKRRIAAPGFFWPLLAFAAWSLLASATSVNPEMSFVNSRKLLLFLIVPLVMAAVDRAGDARLLLAALLVSGLFSSAWSILQYLDRVDPAGRSRGFMGHYMTQAGMLALFVALGLGLALFGRGSERRAWAAALIPAGAALIATFTRGAWIGVAAAACVLLAIWKPKALLVLPLLAALLYWAGPASFKSRIRSIFTLKAYSNMARVEYARAGLKIIGEHPLVGTGPDTVDMFFDNPKYGLDVIARRNVHLHSNVFQIGAERGLPALAAWLVFLGWAAAALFRLRSRGGPAVKPLAAGGLAVLTALFVGGFFEYNFGDSEVAALLLLAISLPFAAARAARAS